MDLNNSYNEGSEPNDTVMNANDETGGGMQEMLEESESSKCHQAYPVKKLSEVFDTCAKAEGNMKVYLRVRPASDKSGETTISVESTTSIVTNAPESSKRAIYTKMEERHYVSKNPPTCYPPFAFAFLLHQNLFFTKQ